MRQSIFTRLLRLLLVVSLAFSPLAQPLALAALTSTAAPVEDRCPHHAGPAAAPVDATAQTPADAPEQPGQCCHLKGAPCHCAMALALPVADLPVAPALVSEHPTSATRLTLAPTVAPEPPPPRA